MAYKIYKIRGKNGETRRARVELTRAWMAQRGWKMVDFAEHSGRAMFEKEHSSRLSTIVQARPWAFPPGYFAGLMEEWLLPRNIVITITMLAVTILVGQMMGSFALDSTPGSGEAENWWRVTADKLNIREEPLPNSRVVGILRQEERVLVGDEEDGWIEVVKPMRGFVARDFVQPPGGEGEEDGE